MLTYNGTVKLGCVGLAMLLITLPACDTSKLLDSSQRKRVKVTITLDGEPVSQARVVFIPQQLYNEQRRLVPLAFGQTDQQGKCWLETVDDSELLDAVRYRCVVTKPVSGGMVPVHLPRDQVQWSVRALWGAQPNEIPEQYNRFSRLSVDLKQEISPTAKIKLPLVTNR